MTIVGPIDAGLFPYYKHLESAVDLFIGASESCKYLYEGRIKDAHTAPLQQQKL
jgi:hypothetical protein